MHLLSFPSPPGELSLVSVAADVTELARWIVNPDRERPIIVLTTRNDERDPYFPPEDVLRLVGAAGDVVVIRHSQKGRLTRKLAQELPDALMVFNGAARIYWPFGLVGDDPKRHPLILADSDESPFAEKRSRLANRWRQGPTDLTAQTPAVRTPSLNTTPRDASYSVGEDALRVDVTRAWLALFSSPHDRDRFALPAFAIDAALVEQMHALKPARAPVAAAAARVLSGHAWAQRAPVPVRVEASGGPVLRSGDLAVLWSYPLTDSDYHLFYWQPASGAPIALERIGVSAPGSSPMPSVVPARRPKLPPLEISDEDLIGVLQAAKGPLYISEIRTALGVPEDVSRERMGRVLTAAIHRGVLIRTGQRRGARYSLR